MVEQVEVSARNDSSLIRLWFCPSYDYIRGKVEFVFSKSHDGFVLKSYSEEITDRLNPENILCIMLNQLYCQHQSYIHKTKEMKQSAS